jgi:hypothetical protein
VAVLADRLGAPERTVPFRSCWGWRCRRPARAGRGWIVTTLVLCPRPWDQLPVRDAHHTDLDAVGAIVAEALGTDPLWEALVPDPGARAGIVGAYYAVLAAHALGHGGPVHLAGDVGCAIWMPWWALPTLPVATLRHICGDDADRVEAAREVLCTARPSGLRFDYLAVLAVVGGQQRDAGLALLDARLRQVMPSHPLYVEATTSAGEQLYARRDWKPYGKQLDISVADGPAVTVRPMLRRWQPASAASKPQLAAAGAGRGR